MQKPAILALVPMMEHVEYELDRKYEVFRLWQVKQKKIMLNECRRRIRGVVTDGHEGICNDLIDQLPALEIISCYGVGYDAIDLMHTSSRSIVVTNTPNVLNDAVAELTIGLMVALCGRIVTMHDYVTTGKWQKNGSPSLTGQLSGSRAGILGLGRIGAEIATRLLSFNMKISYFGRTKKQNTGYKYFSDLSSMASEVDWLIVCAPATSETTKIVSRGVLESLGKEGFLVNVARGSVIDEEALGDLLNSGGIKGAALDVFSNEPNVPKNIRKSDRVLLTPHIGSATLETRKAMGNLVLDNLSQKFHNLEPLTPVQPE